MTRALPEVLATLGQPKLLVVGDLILDRSSIQWIVDLGRAFPDVNLDAVVMTARMAEAPPITAVCAIAVKCSGVFKGNPSSAWQETIKEFFSWDKRSLLSIICIRYTNFSL